MDYDTIPTGTIFRLREEALAWRRVGDEIVALDVGPSNYLRVNRTAAVLWEALAAGATRQQLRAIAVGRFCVDAGRAAGDIDCMLSDLAERGLLEQLAAP